MSKYKTLLTYMFASYFISNVTHAVDPPTRTISVGSNEIVVFVNELDDEYYIGSYSLDPRFSGSNVWTKYGSNNQRSLGYMAASGTFPSNRNVDVWIESPAIAYPYIGIRCLITSSACPSTSYMPPTYVDSQGAYKIPSGGLTRRISFNYGMYTYLRDLNVGSTVNYIFDTCETQLDYNPTIGQRCKDQATGTWNRYSFDVTKYGNVTFLDTKAFSEIWVATDGTPTLAENNELCEQITIGTGARNQGIACRMLEYDVQGNVSEFNSGLTFNLIVDNAVVGYSPNAQDIKLEAGSGNWVNYSASNQIRNIFRNGRGYVRVLFTQQFFSQMLRYGGSTSGQTGTFTFAVQNSNTPQSGYFQFATGVDINIIPREYSISIRHQNQNERSKTGRIGEEDITFDYVVTQSAPRRADVVKASVIGDTHTTNSKSYCLFKSSDNAISVRIPAYLSYTHSSGNTIEEYSGCNSNAAMNMTNASWTAVPWDQQQSGYFYSTNLQLKFPMNDPISLFSVEGIDWLGSVRAEGDVKVEALWLGVNRLTPTGSIENNE